MSLTDTTINLKKILDRVEEANKCEDKDLSEEDVCRGFALLDVAEQFIAAKKDEVRKSRAETDAWIKKTQREIEWFKRNSLDNENDANSLNILTPPLNPSLKKTDTITQKGVIAKSVLIIEKSEIITKKAIIVKPLLKKDGDNKLKVLKCSPNPSPEKSEIIVKKANIAKPVLKKDDNNKLKVLKCSPNPSPEKNEIIIKKANIAKPVLKKDEDNKLKVLKCSPEKSEITKQKTLGRPAVKNYTLINILKVKDYSRTPSPKKN